MNLLGIASANVAIIACVIVTLAVFGAFGWAVIKAYRWFCGRAESAMARAYEGQGDVFPASGRIRVVFHTYYGFIAFVTQTEHQFWASPEQARSILWRLHRFNCRWGLFAYGALFIPFVSYANYLLQKRSIRRQARQLSPTPAEPLG